jgi:hypothetical protein
MSRCCSGIWADCASVTEPGQHSGRVPQADPVPVPVPGLPLILKGTHAFVSKLKRISCAIRGIGTDGSAIRFRTGQLSSPAL